VITINQGRYTVLYHCPVTVRVCWFSERQGQEEEEERRMSSSSSSNSGTGGSGGVTRRGAKRRATTVIDNDPTNNPAQGHDNDDEIDDEIEEDEEGDTEDEEAAHLAAWKAEEAAHKKWVNKRHRTERKQSRHLLEGIHFSTTASFNRTFRWYDAKSGKLESTFKTDNRVQQVLVDPTGSKVAVFRSIGEAWRAAVDVWRIADNKLELETSIRSQILYTAFNWGGTRIVSRVAWDTTPGQLQIWNTEPMFAGERLVLSFSPRIRIRHQLFLMQWNRIIAVGDGLVIIYDTDSGAEIMAVDHHNLCRDYSAELVLANDLQTDMTVTVAVITGGKVICYDVASGQLRGVPLSLSFGRDLAACFASSDTFIHYDMPPNILTMWNIETGENIFRIKIETDIYITHAAFNSITNCIFLIDGKKVHLHDGITGQHICTTKKYEHDILAVHFEVPKVILM
jgi:hypothetical protein